MLETVVEDKDISKRLLFGEETCLISIGANNHGDVDQPTLHEDRFVTRFFPVRADHKNTPVGPAVTARQDHGMQATVAKRFCQRDHDRRFTGSADSKISNADYRMI